MPPCRPGWRGSNAIRPIETTRVHDRFVKSFQCLLTDLHQFDILQSGSAVGGVVPCPSWGQTEKNSLRANVFRVTPESGLARCSRHVSKVPAPDSCTAANGGACSSYSIAFGMTFTVIDDPGYRMSPSFSRKKAFVEPNGTSDVLFRE